MPAGGSLPQLPGEHQFQVHNYSKDAKLSRWRPKFLQKKLAPVSQHAAIPEDGSSSTKVSDASSTTLPAGDDRANSKLGQNQLVIQPDALRTASKSLLMQGSPTAPSGLTITPSRMSFIQQTWNKPVSMDYAADTTQTSASMSSTSGVLGPKVYSYKPLEKDMEFRLVKILPQRTSKLKCEIVHMSLENPQDYIAISYAWGDGSDTKSLVVGGATIFVAASLHGALKAVRRQVDEVLVWVDGLSIDQHNKEERASQVQLMGYIYSRAKFVAVWLGPDADDSQLAIQLLEEVDKGTVLKDRIRDIRNPDSAALRSLFNRDYWNRLWVVQEVFRAQETWVYCGSSRLPWAVYKEASNAFWEHESDPHLRQGPSSFPDVGALVGLEADFLLEVLRACRKKLSDNPRDKIFGILGMLPEDTRKELPVDYDQPVKALFIDVADLIISSTRRLDLIREAVHFPVHISSAGLPSWCPEW